MILDYDIWYEGGIIGNVMGVDYNQALRSARAQYGQFVTVSPTRGTKEEAEAAKRSSLTLVAPRTGK